jgi:hypothetical protein
LSLLLLISLTNSSSRSSTSHHHPFVKMADWPKLPDEVKATVVEEFADASPEWLLEFRQTDRKIKTLTDVHFGKFFFKNLVIFNSTFAAKEFKDMCASPAIGPGIEKSF